MTQQSENDLIREKQRAMLTFVHSGMKETARVTTAKMIEYRERWSPLEAHIRSRIDDVLVVPSFHAAGVLHATKTFVFDDSPKLLLAEQTLSTDVPTEIQIAAQTVLRNSNVLFDCREHSNRRLFPADARKLGAGDITNSWYVFAGAVNKKLAAACQREQLIHICSRALRDLFFSRANFPSNLQSETAVCICKELMHEMTCGNYVIDLPPFNHKKRVASWRMNAMQRVWLVPDKGNQQIIDNTRSLQAFSDIIRIWEACLELDGFNLTDQQRKCQARLEAGDVIDAIQVVKNNTSVVSATNAYAKGLSFDDLFAGTHVLERIG